MAEPAEIVVDQAPATPAAANNVDRPKVVLLKVLGVTTPWSYARKTLVDYSLDKCKDYISRCLDEEHMGRLVELLAQQQVRQQADGLAPPMFRPRSAVDAARFKAELTRYVTWCIQQGFHKLGTPVNDLQSYIWGEGYLNGSLKAESVSGVRKAEKNWKCL